MSKESAGSLRVKEKGRIKLKDVYPKYARNYLWEEDVRPTFLTSADLSEHAPPLPSPPSRSSFSPAFLKTLDDNPHLFEIVTPINIPRFTNLLRDHPNRPFVDSVIRMLTDGAWPWAQPPPSHFPIINDQSQDNTDIVRDPARLQFFTDECDKELAARRFSPPFPDLLPGMSCMPVYVITRKDKMRLVTDQTCTRDPQLGLNSLVAKDERAVPLSNLQQFGYHLRQLRADAASRRVLVYKCDVKGAYRLIPMHPLWQMQQATKLPNGQFAINRNNVFGGGASGRCWWSLMCLVLWIARRHYGCVSLCDYVDDVFSADYDDHFLMHPRYRELMPAGQVRFLQCLDTLQVPYDRPKQLWDYSLSVIGFLVDADRLVLSMPEDSRQALLTAIHDFCRFGTSVPASRRCRSLRQCQALAGHINWALNVYPLLRPGLAALYQKMGGPYYPYKTVHINHAITHDLRWLATHLQESNGLFLLESIAWTPDEAHLVVLTDACPSGFGFWVPSLHLGFYGDTIPMTDSPIFFHEAFAVVCALYWLCRRSIPRRHRIVVRTDNTNTVDMFQSMRAHDAYNILLKFAVDLLIAHDVDLRVLHVRGVDNGIADALSRHRLTDLTRDQPLLQIHAFQPPSTLVEAALQ